MIRIHDRRGTGRTSRLILLAKKTGATIVSPTDHQADYAKYLARLYGILDIDVITFDEFLEYYNEHGCGHGDRNFLIDDLDDMLEYMGVTAYVTCKEGK